MEPAGATTQSSGRRTITFVGTPEAPLAAHRRFVPPRLAPAVAAIDAPNGLGLSHGPGGCPRFTGGEAKQLVRPRTFRQLLQQDGDQIIIPLFQRKYCWLHDQGVKWFADLCMPQKKNGWQGCHNTGKAIFKPIVENSVRTFVCVDGQQRITTTSILLIAIRDAIRKLDASNTNHTAASLLDGIDSLLFSPSHDGATSQWKLVPSLADRYTYAQLLFPNAAQIDDVAAHSSATPNEHIMTMKAIFDQCVGDALDAAGSCEEKLLLLSKIIAQTVDEMYLVSIEIQNDPDLAQVFLWLQEKSLLGMGALLQNLAPGVEFHAADLVRNILFAPFMRTLGLSSASLMDAYVSLWLNPIERMAATPRNVDLLLDAMLSSWYQERQEAPPGAPGAWAARRTYVSPYEQRIMATIEHFRASGVLKYSTDGIERYARFLTFVDDFTPTVATIHPVDSTPETVARAILDCIAQQCSP